MAADYLWEMRATLVECVCGTVFRTEEVAGDNLGLHEFIYLFIICPSCSTSLRYIRNLHTFKIRTNFQSEHNLVQEKVTLRDNWTSHYEC
jgi:hypothetical protein